MNEELADYWVEELAEACKESFADSGQSDHMVKVFSLYDKLEPKVNKARSQRYNIRVITDDNGNLQSLCKRLLNKIDELEDGGNFTLAEDFKEHHLGAILAVAFSGIIAARLDSNFHGMGVVCDWCDGVLGTGKKTKDYSIILAAEYYHIFGSCRREVSKDTPCVNLPSEGKLKSLLDQAEEECKNAEVKDRERYIRQLRLFLVDAITQLPPYRQVELENYNDLLNLDRLQGDKGSPARIYYSLSKVSYAKGDKESLDKAIEYAVDSLQYAKPGDIGFIEQCRQNLLILEQEKAARETIKKEALELANEELEGIIEDTKLEVSKEAHETVNRELKDTLLRVIEILGIFLAVTGAGVTAVGGIAVSDSFWDVLGIYTGGAIAVVILFGLLRLMVLKPLPIIKFRRKQAKLANDKDAAPDDM